MDSKVGYDVTLKLKQLDLLDSSGVNKIVLFLKQRTRSTVLNQINLFNLCFHQYRLFAEDELVLN